jgi:Na+/proline symporter
VVWTDVIQVIILILGGAIASILVLNAVSDGQGVVEGIKMLYEKAPEKFNMILTNLILILILKQVKQNLLISYFPDWVY